MELWTPKYFKIEELVPKNLFNQYRDEQWRLWLLFDNRILLAADALRRKFGPATINDWSWGGSFNESGLRTPDCKYYSFTSQHSWGRALDLKFRDYDAETVRKVILNMQVAAGLITAIEDNVSWNHIDCRLPTVNNQIMVFNP